MTPAPIPPDIEDGWQRLEVGNHFMIRNGPIWFRDGGGAPECGFLPILAEHGNSMGFVHGGMIAAFADLALGQTVWFAHERKPVVTAHLDINYVSAGRPGIWTHCTPEIVRKTRSLVFVRGDILQQDRVVATTNGVWKLLAP